MKKTFMTKDVTSAAIRQMNEDEEEGDIEEEKAN
jgi:hypothetical protein